MTLMELKLIKSVVTDYRNILAEKGAFNGHIRMSLEILNKEIELRTMDPRKQKTDIKGNTIEE